MDRRDFLHPRHLVHTAGQILAAADELVPEAQAPAEDLALLRAARRAMATRFEILLPYGTPDALTLAEAAFDEIDRLEQQLTVYRETSELSRLNRLAPLMPVPVEPGLFDLLGLAAVEALAAQRLPFGNEHKRVTLPVFAVRAETHRQLQNGPSRPCGQ